MHLHVPYPDPWADRNRRGRHPKRRQRRGNDDAGYDVPDTTNREPPPTYH